MTTVTKLSVMQDAVRQIGGYQGSITSGTATTAVLSTLVGNRVDDELIDDMLIMPDAANTSDVERLITDWTKTTGTATWEGSRSDTTFTSETFFTIPKGTWTLDELRAAVNFTLGNTKRTYRYVVPSRDDQLQIQLADLSWLRNARDVEGVYWTNCPGLLHNADFSYWHSGTTSAPDGWTLAGAGASVARQTTYASFGSYEVALTSASADASLTQNVPYALAKQLIDDLVTVSVKARCTATVASEGRVGINDGVDTTWSSYHSGDGEPEDLTVSRTLTAAASRVQIVCETATGTNTVSFDFVAAVEGSSVPDDFFNSGGTAYRTQSTTARVWNVGSGVPVLALDTAKSRGGQWVVVTYRPFATLATDSASTEADTDMVVAGTLYNLAIQRKRGVSTEYLDNLARIWGPAYDSLASGLIDKPMQEPQSPAFYVRGA